MIKSRIAINGFGRIGRLTLRALHAYPDITIAAINDLAPVATLAHLLKYDSTHGPFPAAITHDKDHLIVDQHKIPVTTESNPAHLPWEKQGVQLVIEATGRFTDLTSASQHLAAGAQRVVISAPGRGEVPMIVLGVNEHIFCPKMRVISNASCTTHCLAPLVKVLDDHFGIEHGYMTTTHAYTADQPLQDAPHKDLRRTRAATQSIIPTTTGATKGLGLVLPHLQGKLTGMALRVPVIDGSLVDLTVRLHKKVTTKTINKALQQAANGVLQHTLDYTEDPIVSADIIGNPHSCIVDAQLTHVQEHHLARVIGWYDNEWAYAKRLAELVAKII